MIRPNLADANPPQIEVLDQQAHQSLPPRPDAAHPNPSPALSTASVSIDGSRALVVLLKVLVLVDGEVGSAKVVGSCGYLAIDETAVRFVKANWRFLPALDNGVPTSTWATMEVSFLPAA
jgi:TonB family protein